VVRNINGKHVKACENFSFAASNKLYSAINSKECHLSITKLIWKEWNFASWMISFPTLDEQCFCRIATFFQY